MIQFFVHLILWLDVFIYLFYNHVTALLKYEYTDALHYTSTRDACYKSTMYFYIHYIHIYNMHTHTHLTYTVTVFNNIFMKYYVFRLTTHFLFTSNKKNQSRAKHMLLFLSRLSIIKGL